MCREESANISDSKNIVSKRSKLIMWLLSSREAVKYNGKYINVQITHILPMNSHPASTPFNFYHKSNLLTSHLLKSGVHLLCWNAGGGGEVKSRSIRYLGQWQAVLDMEQMEKPVPTVAFSRVFNYIWDAAVKTGIWAITSHCNSLFGIGDSWIMHIYADFSPVTGVVWAISLTY